MPAVSSGLSDRAQHLLKALVQRYIKDGQPVGSRILSRDSGLELSPATIRNVIADLEELGLVRSPHTSAGRVPTVQGYRLFVDTLLTVAPLNSEEIRKVRRQLGSGAEQGHLMDAASQLLSGLTNMAGVVMLPRQEMVTLRQIEFLPLSESEVLVILVINEREVQNRIIRTARRYEAGELERASNYLNEVFSGKDLQAIREQLLGEMRDARETMNRMMMAAVEMAGQAFAVDAGQDDVLVSGQTNLMEYGELSDMDKLRQLFEAFNYKRGILHLLDQSLKAEGVQIFIGEESGYDALDECSVVTAAYTADGEVQGVLGVIGPTRMAYERVIPIVDLTAKLVSSTLNQQH